MTETKDTEDLLNDIKNISIMRLPLEWAKDKKPSIELQKPEE